MAATVDNNVCLYSPSNPGWDHLSMWAFLVIFLRRAMLSGFCRHVYTNKLNRAGELAGELAHGRL